MDTAWVQCGYELLMRMGKMHTCKGFLGLQNFVRDERAAGSNPVIPIESKAILKGFYSHLKAHQPSLLLSIRAENIGRVWAISAIH
jgi:hypothetical protein